MSNSNSNSLPAQDDDIARRIADAFLAAAKLWSQCDWPTTFGARRLDLNGLSSRQATLMSDATSGDESLAWTAAAKWLAEVERNALLARSKASGAVDLFAANERSEALEQIIEACEIEARYRKPIVWEPIRQLIDSFI